MTLVRCNIYYFYITYPAQYIILRVEYRLYTCTCIGIAGSNVTAILEDSKYL